MVFALTLGDYRLIITLKENNCNRFLPPFHSLPNTPHSQISSQLYYKEIELFLFSELGIHEVNSWSSFDWRL